MTSIQRTPLAGNATGELPDQAALLKKNGYNVVGGSPGSHELLATKANEKWRSYCLPDTVDPRGPKGK